MSTGVLWIDKAGRRYWGRKTVSLCGTYLVLVIRIVGQANLLGTRIDGQDVRCETPQTIRPETNESLG